MTGDSPSKTSQVSYTQHAFSVVDYVIFALLLSMSGAVGVYFYLKGHKNTSEYFFGGRQLGTISTGISYGVSFLSTLSLVGIPSEIYVNGIQYLIQIGSGSLGFFAGGALIACVIYPLDIMSLSEYFAHRYNSRVLTFTANLMVLLCIVQYMGACMLGSIVALTTATGGQVSIIAGLIIAGSVGTFYTAIGGLRAVVWADVIQFVFMIAGIIAIIIKSTIDTRGGVSEIWEMNKKYKRIDSFSWSLDPTVRHTIWGMIIGRFLYFLLWPIQPAAVQRLCSVKTRTNSFKIAVIAALMNVLFMFIPAWMGFNIFGYYANRGCDIFAAGWVTPNEIVPYYVRERFQYPGFQGFFVASLFAASLSSFSSGLSAASVIIWKDMIKPALKVEVTEMKATLISKIIAALFGVLSMLWCFTLHTFGGFILQLSSSIDSSMYGAYFSLFAFAIFFRFGTYKGALAGVWASFLLTSVLGFASLMHGQSMAANFPTVTSNCSANSTNSTNIEGVKGLNTTFSTDNSTLTGSGTENRSFIETLLSISYVWMPLICLMIFFLVATLVTFCTGSMSREHLDPHHLFPLCRPKHWQLLDKKSRGHMKPASCTYDAEELHVMVNS